MTRRVRRGGRQFLDDEAELSEEDGPVSSDEEDDEEQSQMLEGFVVDNSHLSQGLNGAKTVDHCGLLQGYMHEIDNTLICLFTLLGWDFSGLKSRFN